MHGSYAYFALNWKIYLSVLMYMTNLLYEKFINFLIVLTWKRKETFTTTGKYYEMIIKYKLYLKKRNTLLSVYLKVSNNFFNQKFEGHNESRRSVRHW